MKTTINPYAWASYTKMLVVVDKHTRFEFGEINLSNIEKAAPYALEILAKEAIRRNMSVDEFAYVLYTMNEDNIAYMAIFAEESIYGKIHDNERERIVDGIANIYYSLANGMDKVIGSYEKSTLQAIPALEESSLQLAI